MHKVRCIHGTDADGADVVIGPEVEIGQGAALVVCDGTNYIVYEPGDELPQQEE